MAATGYTPLSLYYTTTAAGVPLAVNLVNGELAINITDGKLFYKDNSGVVQTLASKSAGTVAGLNTQVIYNSSGAYAGSANLTFNGTTLTAAGFSGPLNGTIGATTPTTGAFTTAKAIAAATQDAVQLQGRAGGTSSYVATITPTTLTASRTLTLPDATGTILQSGTTVTVAQGGTGITAGTSGGVLYYSAAGTLASSAALGANGVVYGGGAGTAPSTTVAGSTNQVLLGNTAAAPSWGAVSLSAAVSGTLPVGNGGTGATTLTGLVKGSGTSAFTAATAGTDYVAPGTATSFTAAQTFSGSTSVLAAVFTNMAEVATVSATAATGTINYDVTTQSVLYYTTNASANWTVNFRASSGTSLNTALAVGRSVTVAFLVTQGATAYYNNVVQIDGTTVTPKWQGGTAPTAGNASSVDVYSYTIVKTAATPTYAVFASQTKFA